MTTSSTPVPELLLEQLALGEIEPADERWLRSQLDAAEIERRIAALRAADARFHAQHPAEPILNAIDAKLRIERAKRDVDARSKLPMRALLPSLAVIGCALFFLARPATNDSVGPRIELPEKILIKGLAPHLVLYRRVGERADTLSDGAEARRGDMLQVGYVAAQAEHGVIVSIDGAGAVTLHFPDSEVASTQLQGKGEQLLMHAYELDAAPSFERFVFVTGKKPIDVTKVLEAARSLARTPARAQRAALSLESGLAQHAVTLVKE